MPQELVLEKFQGPLDLLLQLIGEKQLSITEIALAEVTEQYLKYLSTRDEEGWKEMADFLVVAAQLVYLKSRQLLPHLYPPEPDEGIGLAEQLKLYKRYAEASHAIAELWERGAIAYGRLEPLIPVKGLAAPLNAGLSSLRQAYLLLLERLKPLPPLPQAQIDRGVSVRQKIAALYETLTRLKRITFRELLNGAGNRSEIIVSFLALLELLKEERVMVQQVSAFAELIIVTTL